MRHLSRIIYNKIENEEISAMSSDYKHKNKTVQVKKVALYTSENNICQHKGWGHSVGPFKLALNHIYLWSVV